MYPPLRNLSSENHLIENQAYGNGFYVISSSDTRGSLKPFTCFDISENNGGHWDNNKYEIPDGTFKTIFTDNS